MQRFKRLYTTKINRGVPNGQSVKENFLHGEMFRENFRRGENGKGQLTQGRKYIEPFLFRQKYVG